LTNKSKTRLSVACLGGDGMSAQLLMFPATGDTPALEVSHLTRLTMMSLRGSRIGSLAVWGVIGGRLPAMQWARGRDRPMTFAINGSGEPSIKLRGARGEVSITPD